MYLVDTHAHLDFPPYREDREEVIARARAAGVARILNVGADLESSRASVELAERHAFI
ncbi:MAG: hydrolase TatD, partial [Thermoflexia bacterium]